MRQVKISLHKVKPNHLLRQFSIFITSLSQRRKSAKPRSSIFCVYYILFPIFDTGQGRRRSSFSLPPGEKEKADEGFASRFLSLERSISRKRPVCLFSALGKTWWLYPFLPLSPSRSGLSSVSLDLSPGLPLPLITPAPMAVMDTELNSCPFSRTRFRVQGRWPRRASPTLPRGAGNFPQVLPAQLILFSLPHPHPGSISFASVCTH